MAKLDALFGQLETLNNGLARIPKLLKKFRQTVLNQAVTGKLTEDWREVQLKDITGLDVGEAFKSKNFTTDGIKLLRGQNIEPNSLRWIDTVYYSEENLKEFRSIHIKEGDIILAMDRPVISTGLKLAIAKKEDLPCVLVQRVAKFKPNADIDSKFLYIILNSPQYVYHLIGNQQGTQIPHISANQILSFKLLLPPLKEQQEIVRQVEALLARADALQAQYEQLRATVGRLPQAILAKAFRGELVPQNPADVPASELLAQVQQQATYLSRTIKGQTELF